MRYYVAIQDYDMRNRLESFPYCLGNFTSKEKAIQYICEDAKERTNGKFMGIIKSNEYTCDNGDFVELFDLVIYKNDYFYIITTEQ